MEWPAEYKYSDDPIQLKYKEDCRQINRGQEVGEEEQKRAPNYNNCNKS